MTRLWLKLLVLLAAMLAMAVPALGQQADEPADGAPEVELTAEELAEQEAQQTVLDSLISLNDNLQRRLLQRSALSQAMAQAEDEAVRQEFASALDELNQDIQQLEQEIEIVALGLQAQNFRLDDGGGSDFNLTQEVSKIFEPLVISLERATEPSRRIEELRQLLQVAERRRTIAQDTLDHIDKFLVNEEDLPDDLRLRLQEYRTLWQTRVTEAENLITALDKQLQDARKAQGNTLERLGSDIGSFILNRGVSLLLAIGLALAFVMLCQGVRIAVSSAYRKRRSPILPAPIRIFNLFLNVMGVVGALAIAVAVFNIRHDWLLLALSLLLAIGISWSFVRGLPIIMEQMRLLLNLGPVREGERTVVNGVPYRIDKLSFYSELINPQLEGGKLIFPLKQMGEMNSRPVNPDEQWFPTDRGDWILNDGSHYEVVRQTPEHVIIRRPGGMEDFVPTGEFIDKEFYILSNGYRATYDFGLGYRHLSEARDEVREKVSAAVTERLATEIGPDNFKEPQTFFESLGDSALMFRVQADIGPGQGANWLVVHRALNLGVVDACIDNGWEIPFPQLVIHKAED